MAEVLVTFPGTSETCAGLLVAIGVRNVICRRRSIRCHLSKKMLIGARVWVQPMAVPALEG